MRVMSGAVRMVARVSLVVALISAAAVPAAAQGAQRGGVIEGRVLDAISGNPLTGAVVFVTGTRPRRPPIETARFVSRACRPARTLSS